MAQNAMEWLISEITDDPLRRECLRRDAARLQEELARDHPSPIGRIPAERVAVCSLDTYDSDIVVYKGCSPLKSDLTRGRQDRAQRRYLEAVKAPAQCRKIEASTIQGTVERSKIAGVVVAGPRPARAGPADPAPSPPAATGPPPRLAP